MVGIVIVSHSKRLAEGVKELLNQAVKGNVIVESVGGLTIDPKVIGTDPLAIKRAILHVMDRGGVLIVCDLGSAIISSKAAIKMLPKEIGEKVTIADAPLVEGSFAAAVEISSGGSLNDAKNAAEDSKNLRKV